MRKPVSRSPAVTGRCGQPGRPRMAAAEGGASRSGCEHNDSHGQAHLLLCVLCQTPLPRTHRRRDRSRAPTRDGREQGGEEGTRVELTEADKFTDSHSFHVFSALVHHKVPLYTLQD